MKETTSKIQWILLGLLMLLPGLIKLFVFKPAGVTQMLSGIILFSWAPAFWAWVLILSEIVFGVLILAKWNLKYTTIPPIIILAVATLFVAINWSDITQTQIPNLLLHLLAINGYCMLRSQTK